MRLLTAGLLVAALAAGGCKKQKSATASAAPAPAADTPAAGGGGGANTNYQPGAGAAQNVRQAARRAVALNDMHSLGQLIEVMYNDLGKMPDVNRIKAELRTSANILAQVNDGTIILTGTTNHAGLWAYEAEADTKGGIGLVAGTARRMTADEIKQARR